MKQTENNKENHAVKLIPLGGLGEIGKNITVLEYKDDILVIDCGLAFPDDEMFGIDIVIPDFSYLVKNSEKIRGVILTHGHEDHIGAIPYLLKELDVPLYGTRLTLGLVENKLKEHGITAKTNVIKAGQTLKLGVFNIETLRMTHSVADALGFAIETPAGVVFHTGDFKIDYTPLDGEPIDLQQLARIGSKGVLLMLADSTNAERKGYTPSEKTVGVTLENIFRNSTSRILAATFASNVHRLQKIIDTAVMFNRKVAISGRSMVNVVSLATEIGYLKIPANVLVDINKIKNIKDSELVIITTGSQGEPMSALSRMAANEHKAVQIKKGDMVILSSSPIPGNEKTVSNIVNKLLEKGAEVIYSDIADIHVTGHACAEELKLVHMLIKPKFFMPVHGEYRHLREHGKIAENLGMQKEKIFILSNGETLSLKKNQVQKTKETVACSPVMVDGLGIGDVGNIVLRDRKLLSEAGLIIVIAAIDKATGEICSGPDIISRGFVYVRESEDLIESAKQVAIDRLLKCQQENTKDWGAMKNAVRTDLQNFIYQRTKRNPVILPIFMEV
ncbi:MAG: ribonuclease J [Eubacteriales bacterium]|nr:ribonuclease J [Eubacteriales bacterium]MDD3349482.1 ribonuclease J [Eubacteriales bacterium]